jgi:NTE family protein
LFNSKSRLSLVLAVLLPIVLGGCATYPVNDQMENLNTDDRVDFANMRQAERLGNSVLLLVTFSGGGTRAAALSYGVLEVLANTSVNLNGNKGRLIDEIDLISSVSGGSFVAAYYGLYGDKIFDGFESRFLKNNVQGALTRQLFNPKNWLRLPSNTFGRSDLAAELYDQYLFAGLTFGDLRDSTGPAVVINTTDAVAGTQFSFLQPHFDWLCSDISSYPVSRAVAASSAVPGVLGSISLHNYSGSCNYETPDWVKLALDARDTYSTEFRQAERIASYMDADKRPYIHLLDGGLSDNLGVRTIIDQIKQHGGLGKGLKKIGADDITKLVVLVVNAETTTEKDLNLLESLPLAAQLGVASGVPINRYNYETVALLLGQMDSWRDEVMAERCGNSESGQDYQDSQCAGLDTYFIEVEFDALADESEKQYFKELPTSFKLSGKEVDNLRDAAARILGDSAEFQRLLKDLD